MKKLTLTLALALTALTLVSCDKDEPKVDAPTNNISIDATSKTTWHYFSLTSNKVVGTGEENATDNAAWFARTDWDIAICRYNVRTNSGAATTVGSKGGVAITTGITLADITTIPSAASFKVDKAITSTGMGGATSTEIFSAAAVIQFKLNAEGGTIMPPVFLKSPVYVFRTADSKSHYKIEFVQYQDANKVSGHVKFNSAKM